MGLVVTNRAWCRDKNSSLLEVSVLLEVVVLDVVDVVSSKSPCPFGGGPFRATSGECRTTFARDELVPPWRSCRMGKVLEDVSG